MERDFKQDAVVSAVSVVSGRAVAVVQRRCAWWCKIFSLLNKHNLSRVADKYSVRQTIN